MRRKVISFMTVLVMLFAMIPMQAYGEDEVPPADPTIDAAISIQAIEGVTVPVKGAAPVTTIAETTQYTATINWSGNPEIFAADTEYTATITIAPKTGFTLTGVSENYFTVAGAETSNGVNSGEVSALFPKTAADEAIVEPPGEETLPPAGGDVPEKSPEAIQQEIIDAELSMITTVEPTESAITISAISGVTPPETDAVPVTTLPDTAQFSAVVTWSGITTSVFEPNTTYTASITITPLAGYTLTGVPANFFTVAGAEDVTNDADSGIVTAVFPATGSPQPPEFLYGYTNTDGDAITLVFDKEMAPPSATEAGFTVAVNGNNYGSRIIYPIAVNSVGLDSDSGEAIVLLLDEAVLRGDVVTVDYNPGFAAAANGVALEAFDYEYIIYNEVPIKIVSDLEGTWWYYDHVGWWGEDKDYVEPNWEDPAPPYFLTGDDDPRGVEFNRHIVTNDNEVIFYGYGEPGYKDFVYLPSEDDAAKSFYFDLDLGQIKYHSMEGGGFLFNTEIVYDEGTDTEYLYGYCVLFTAVEEYVDEVIGNVTRYVAKLYELDGIDVADFSEGEAPYDTLEGSSEEAGVTLLKEVELPEGNLHSFTLEVSSSTVDLWDDATKLIDTLLLPEDDMGNGVGVIASYKDHGCYELSYFIFSSLSIEGIANLSAALNGTEADLNFTAPTGATSVTVEQSKDGKNFTPAKVISPIKATDTTATVTGLEPETTYFFRLLIQGGQYEGYSRIATALYTGPIKNLAATPDDGKAHLTFSPPIGATKVEVMQSEDGGGNFTPAAIEGELGTMPSSATVVGLTNGKQYWFKLIVTEGVNAGDSNIASVTPNVQQHHQSSGGSSNSVPKNILRFQIADTNCYLTSGSAIETKIPMDVSPIIFENRTLLPIRYVVEPLGGEASWDQSEQKATVTLGGITVELWVGKNTAKVNGVEKMIDPLNPNVVPIIVEPGRTMLPIRFVAESLGCTVDWKEATKEVIVQDWD